MYRMRFVFVSAFCLCVSFMSAASFGDVNPQVVMRMMPAEFPLTIVVPNFEKLDKSLMAVQQRFDPGNNNSSMLEELKRDIEIGKWIDFSQPVGLAAASFDDKEDWIVWAAVPKALEKLKALDGAKETEGIWEFSTGGDDIFFVAIKNNYVIGASTREGVAKTTKVSESIADQLKGRMDLLNGRDALVHLDFASLRPKVQAGTAQFAQMIPMIAMMAGQQGGAAADPTALIGMFTALVESVNSLSRQMDYIDFSVGVSETDINMTLATGFIDGPIKTYLAQQKPAQGPLFSKMTDQPYFLATAFQIPGDTSPFMDFVFDKMEKAAAMPAGMPGQADGGQTHGGQGAMKEYIANLRAFYGAVEGADMVMGASSGGMRMTADYLGKDTRNMVELVKKAMTGSNPMMQFGGATGMESLGTKKIGDASVEQFAMKIDTTNPAGAAAASMYGENMRFGIAAVGDRARFAMGSEEDLARVFSGRITASFGSGDPVKTAMAKLPKKCNVVTLIDPAGILPLVGPLMGMRKMDPVPPGPPVALSISFVGEPARIDINVPLRSIERVMQAVAPDEAM